MAIYLYVKTHNVTGLKYLGMTRREPFQYSGSGKYWKQHLRKHGTDLTTNILLETENEEEFKETAIFFSNLWKVEESSEWANCKPEEGQGNSSETSRKLALKRIKEGTHNFQGARGSAQSKKNHLNNPEIRAHLYGGEFQRKIANIRVQNGTHNLLGSVPVIDRFGNRTRIPKELYYSQAGEMQQRDYVHFSSHEAKTRRLIE